MAMGRPLKFKSVKKLQAKIDEYFANTPLEMQTITGLALFLDTSRETLCDYQCKPNFSDTIKKAKDRVEHAYEMRGIKRGGAFDIFALKNFGWRDRQELEHTTPEDRAFNINITTVDDNRLEADNKAG